MSEMPTAQELLEDDLVEEESTEAEVPDAETAFIVVIDHDGTVRALAELGNPFSVLRSATIEDMRRACSEVIHEVQITKTANAVLGGLQKLAAVQEVEKAASRTNAKVARRLKDRGIDVKGV